MNISSVKLNHASPVTGPKWAAQFRPFFHHHRNSNFVSFESRTRAAPSSLAVTANESPNRIELLSQVSGVLGCQWGDEGKGKLVDILAEHFDIVARCQVHPLSSIKFKY